MAPPRQPQSFQDLSDDLLAVAERAQFYADRASQSEPNSAARLDSENLAYALPHLTNVGFEATLMAGRSLTLSVDMLRGIAHLLPVDQAFFSKLSLIRPVMSSASRSTYLTEPGIDAKERVRRWANLAMDSVVEQANLLALDTPERLSILDKLAELETLAPRLGYPTTPHKPDQRPMRLRPIGKHESDMMMVKRLIPDRGLGLKTGNINPSTN
jgi:hypothetical protein